MIKQGVRQNLEAKLRATSDEYEAIIRDLKRQLQDRQEEIITQKFA